MPEISSLTRIVYHGPIENVLDHIVDVFQLSPLISHEVISIGYEDCNIRINTVDGNYLAKIFSTKRTTEIIHRYAEIMTRAMDIGVHHPTLHRTKNHDLVFTDKEANNISLVLMDFIEGITYLEKGSTPTSQELDSILEDAYRINTIPYHPSFLFDAWAIPHIHEMYERTKIFIAKIDQKLIEEAIRRYEAIPLKKLPHCLVHGDLTKANVLKGNDGIVYLLDFSVTNWNPRIQELAIIVENLLFSEQNPTSIKERSELVLEKYHRLNPLTDEERMFLPSYALAGAAMEFMGAHQEKFLKGNDTEETAYWLDLGRRSLRQELA